MRHPDRRNASESSSPPPHRPNPPSEQTDEAPGQIESDEVDVERGIPAEPNESIEQSERTDHPDAPLFED